MLTLTGCGTAETVGPEAAGTGAPAAGGVTVVVIAWFVCPAAGGCTTVVVVVPFLSTETTCCACPVVTACFLAWSSACSCLELHPERAAVTKTSTSTGIRPALTNEPELNMFDPLSIYPSSNAVSRENLYCGSELPAPEPGPLKSLTVRAVNSLVRREHIDLNP